MCASLPSPSGRRWGHYISSSPPQMRASNSSSLSQSWACLHLNPLVRRHTHIRTLAVIWPLISSTHKRIQLYCSSFTEGLYSSADGEGEREYLHASLAVARTSPCSCCSKDIYWSDLCVPFQCVSLLFSHSETSCLHPLPSLTHWFTICRWQACILLGSMRFWGFQLTLKFCFPRVHVIVSFPSTGHALVFPQCQPRTKGRASLWFHCHLSNPLSTTCMLCQGISITCAAVFPLSLCPPTSPNILATALPFLCCCRTNTWHHCLVLPNNTILLFTSAKHVHTKTHCLFLLVINPKGLIFANNTMICCQS